MISTTHADVAQSNTHTTINAFTYNGIQKRPAPKSPKGQTKMVLNKCVPFQKALSMPLSNKGHEQTYYEKTAICYKVRGKTSTLFEDKGS